MPIFHYGEHDDSVSVSELILTNPSKGQCANVLKNSSVVWSHAHISILHEFFKYTFLLFWWACDQQIRMQSQDWLWNLGMILNIQWGVNTKICHCQEILTLSWYLILYILLVVVRPQTRASKGKKISGVLKALWDSIVRNLDVEYPDRTWLSTWNSRAWTKIKWLLKMNEWTL